jgi:hypothetical protein
MVIHELDDDWGCPQDFGNLLETGRFQQFCKQWVGFPKGKLTGNLWV